jgi:hypothetical protein
MEEAQEVSQHISDARFITSFSWSSAFWLSDGGSLSALMGRFHELRYILFVLNSRLNLHFFRRDYILKSKVKTKHSISFQYG